MSWLDRIKAWFSPRRESAFDYDTEAPVRRSVFGAAVAPVEQVGRLPRFNSLASETRDLDHRGAEVGDALARLALAFVASQPITDFRQFAGREELVGRLIRAIEDQRMHVVVFGERGAGKTSLLHVLGLLALEARYLVRYSSCSASSDFDATFRAIARDIPLLYHRDVDPTSGEVESGQTLAGLLDERPLTANALSEVLEKVEGTRVLIVLDEFDRAESEDFRRAVAELIKNLSDRAARVQILIGGVASNLADLIAQIPSIRRNVLGVAVGPMPEAELAQIIDRGEAVSRLHFAEAARRRLFDAAAGSPYLVNLIAHAAGVEAIGRGSGGEVAVLDVDAALGRLAGEFTDRLSTSGRAQLTQLEAAVPDEVLRQAAGQALENFGRLEPEMARRLADLLAPGSDQGAGDSFAFAEETLPTVLWLKDRAKAAA